MSRRKIESVNTMYVKDVFFQVFLQLSRKIFQTPNMFFAVHIPEFVACFSSMNRHNILYKHSLRPGFRLLCSYPDKWKARNETVIVVGCRQSLKSGVGAHQLS